MKIRVLLVDDHSFIRRALRIALGDESALEIVGEAENGQLAIAQIENLKPDVVLMDIQMPVMDGVEATRQIGDRFPETKILILTVDDTEEYISQALKYGASGYILKNTQPEELSFAIQAVYRGYMHLDLNLGRKVIARIPENVEVSTTDWVKLTPREQQIVKLIATGVNNEEIASQLYISTKTVKNHVTNILSQLNLRNRTQIAILVNSILNYS
ncbi:MAG: response regulator [Pseudanabaena sp.]|jgi:DNA-binding NarL/FixJ family response regulator|uniref:response regulator n=1 Tax=Pseudanabaena mucicola TaxID=71190 RepID=UPI002576F34F|nr:response regulator transcription factor [Pseudanabaena mucicola]MCA6574692.1 response regulator transcription factor [Pseudanabaena sp. M53BS1SP1A06MG]MCA6582802.1 response regulator transcription factor [Pseudanabaena sp. M34BS1SP1A06MG]MCA6586722.1 response regulator transcription factor [Pseudanabaena sp. M051S1SP1A06QC]MCA6590182.1 response regulator transcription factor [Pseudanabaena sp. M109S1SP1A06QC]MCA6594194.1 response regulator transcription factor [Pseudanabaena sp. M38BS1SP1A0